MRFLHELCAMKLLSIFVNFSVQTSDIRSLCIIHSAEDGQDSNSEDAPENNPQYTTVYVGNLAPEVS